MPGQLVHRCQGLIFLFIQIKSDSSSNCIVIKKTIKIIKKTCNFHDYLNKTKVNKIKRVRKKPSYLLKFGSCPSVRNLFPESGTEKNVRLLRNFFFAAYFQLY